MSTPVLEHPPAMAVDAAHRDKLLRLAEAAAARGLTPLLTLAQSVQPSPRTMWHAATRAGGLLIANLETADAAIAGAVLAEAPALGIRGYVDVANKRFDSQLWRELLTDAPGTGAYSDLAVWAEAILGVVIPHLPPSPMHELLLVGASPLTDAVAQRAAQLGYDVVRGLSIVGAEPGAMALIGTAFHAPVITAADLNAIARDGVAPLCIDGGIGTFTPDALAVAQAHGWLVWRPDMRAALVAAIEQAEQYRRLVQHLAGRRQIAEVWCVAGGVLGSAGDVVLDRIDAPTEILGWADGRGGLVRESDDAAWVASRKRVEESLGLE